MIKKIVINLHCYYIGTYLLLGSVFPASFTPSGPCTAQVPFKGLFCFHFFPTMFSVQNLHDCGNSLETAQLVVIVSFFQ